MITKQQLLDDIRVLDHAASLANLNRAEHVRCQTAVRNIVAAIEAIPDSPAPEPPKPAQP